MTDRIDIDLETLDSPYSHLEDGEYTLRVGNAEYKDSKSGRPMCVVRFDAPDPEDETQTIFINHYIMLDNRRGLYQFKQLCVNAGVDLKQYKGDPASWDFSGLVGSEVEAVVLLEENPEYGKQNRVKSLDVKI